MSEYGYIPESPDQSFGNNKGIFTPKDIYDLTRADKYTNYGQLELIETQTASADSFIDFTSIQESTYNVHFMTFNNISHTTSGSRIYMRLYESGVLESASVYQFALQYGKANGTFGEDKSTAQTFIANIGDNIDTGSSYMYFYNLGDSSKYSFTTGQSTWIAGASNFTFYFGSGVLPQASAVDGIRAFDSSGSTFSGTISLYGIRYS
jgi:hypothetical protein